MLSFTVWRLLFGAVRFCATGGFSARFLNLCDSGKLHVWDLRQDEEGVCGFVSARDYRRLRTTAKKAGMRLCCVEKRGLPFFLRRNRNRWGLLAGAWMCVLLAVWTSGFLWTVETGEIGSANAQEILSAAAQIGLFSGARKPKENGEDLAIALRRQMDGALSWAAVNIKGGRVVIEAREAEKLETLPEEPFGDPCDLVADFDGLLLQLEVHSGEKKNEVGNGVKKGDLLISGTRIDREGKAHLYEARGIATALHEDARMLHFPTKTTLLKLTAVRRVPVLHLWHLSVPLGFFPRGETFTACRRTVRAALHSVTLPFSVEWRTRYYWREDEAESVPLAFDSFLLSLDDAYRSTRVLEGSVSIETVNGICTLTQRSRVIDFIGVKRAIRN